VRDDRPAGAKTPPAVWFAYTPARKEGASESAPERFPGHAAGRCVRRVRADLRSRKHPGSRLLGPRAQKILRSSGRTQISGGRGDASSGGHLVQSSLVSSAPGRSLQGYTHGLHIVVKALCVPVFAGKFSGTVHKNTANLDALFEVQLVEATSGVRRCMQRNSFRSTRILCTKESSVRHSLAG
jgi:hypothetical protein